MTYSKLTQGSSSAVAEVESADMAQCVIRTAVAQDIPHIVAIYTRFVESSTATSEITPPSEPEMLRRWRVAVGRELPYLVAELEGYVVGFAYTAQFRPREGYSNTVEDSIYVRPDCIGHGVGKLLLAELIVRCQSSELHSIHSMVACIVGDNPSSVALHASFGFQRAGELTDAVHKFDQWLPMLLMQRLL